MRTLLIATSNRGKLRDFAVAASTQSIVVKPLPAIERIQPPDETADTFEGNARDKAIYYSRFAPGQIVVTDDSGLEVDALGGAPGVRSARYAADAQRARQTPHPSAAQIDRNNNELLLKNLATMPHENRTARYRCVLVAARERVVLATAEGLVEGTILKNPQGSGGFGYDPLFYLPQLRQTMAEISPQAKDFLSHRGRAFRSLLTKLTHLEP